MEVRYTTELPEKEVIYELYEQLDWNKYLKLDAEQLSNAMKGSYYSIYAYSGDCLIATGRIISDGIINAYICGLGVLTQYRHNGIGTTIMELLTKKCKENNLHTQFFCEEHLVPFYEKMGFHQFATGMKNKD